jgi:Cu+-exporting ATPase
LLSVASGIETFSEHPLARAVMNRVKEKNIQPLVVTDFANVAGKGAEGVIAGTRVAVGSVRFAEERGIELAGVRSDIDRLGIEAKTILVVTKENRVMGIIGVADTAKADANAAVEALAKAGMKSVMITGDNEATARAMAKMLGIDEVVAHVLPQDKAKAVKDLQAKGLKVAFVGDGVNDAPALVQSDLGIAMGTGTDVAIESGDIVLVKGNPLKVALAIKLSQRTFRIITQNLFWAFFYNVAAIPLAVFGLLNPMIAGAAMAASSVSVVVNSLRIKRNIVEL